MPVQSKHFTSRTKISNVLLSPQPYHKTETNAWSFTDNATQGTRARAKSTGDRPAVPPRISLLRQPFETGNVVRSVQRIGFSSHEVNEIDNKDRNDVTETTFHETPTASTSGYEAKGSKLTSSIGLSGAQALKECEEHTDWVNEILLKNKLPPVTDLRRSIGDGYTLPSLIEIIADVSLSCVKTNPSSKEERVLNLIHCLKFLCRRNVDITGIDPKEVEDGNLRSVLLLIGNVRKHFQSTYVPEQNGYTDSTQILSNTNSKTVTQSIISNMPGTMKLPGAIPTPFVPQNHRKNNGPESSVRKSSYPDDEILPGVMGRESNNNNQEITKPHFNIISTTEIGANGVAQHGVDERKHHFANPNPNPTSNRGMVIRHPNARTSIPNSQDQHPTHPPTVTQRAWTASPRQLNNNVNGKVGSPSVEDRLKNLLGSNSSRDNMGYYTGEGFHGGGSEILDDDDGELLIVPPPMSRNSTDFDSVMLSEHGFGPGYRPISGQQHTRQRSQQGYVPSKPSERVQGSRAEVIISRPPSAIAFRTTAPNRPIQARPPIQNNRESSPYKYEVQSAMNNTNNVTASPRIQDKTYKPPGPIKTGSNDLRNAWNKLYGPQGQPMPQGQPTSQGQTAAPQNNNGITRGDHLRSSYGHQSQHRLMNNKQPLVKFAQSSAQSVNRPVSAPAPAHMQSYFQNHEQQLQGQGQSQSQDNLDNQGQGHTYTSHQRESPMGQSSSTQGHLDESSSSQQSRASQEQAQKHLQLQTSTDNNYGKLSHSSQSHSSLSQPSPTSPGSPDYAIGPGTKYPDNPNSRPSSARKPTNNSMPQSPSQKQMRPRMPLPQQINDNVIRNDLRQSAQNLNASFNDVNQRSRHTSGNNQFSEDLKSALNAASREQRTLGKYDFNESHDMSHDRSHDLSHDFQTRSIFDYNPPSRSESSGSVTPPLPPLSPNNTPPESPRTDPGSTLPRSLSATNVPSALMDETDGLGPMNHASRKAAEINMRNNRPLRGKKSRHNRGFKSKGGSINDVRESCTDTESNLSFDIDDTILTVESHDTEQPHPAGDIMSSREVNTIREHLHDLEFKYHNLQTKVNTDQPLGHHSHLGASKGPLGPPPIGRQRRWSIGSSDTSSFRRESKYKPGKQILHKHHSKEFKNINKRFQRLESHVVTLARSVAHLSSELRTHNTMVNDLETIKRELREIRDNPSRPFPNMIDRTMTEQERFRDWVPSLTNPKRVNKLTKFFGTEPPLLELFLEKLGYKRYVSNFQSEHIGMIELPYMTEDRLEKIGVPMGPRIRILQEAQSCFRQENMNVYIV
ncbi:hypothetical protein ACF0H5_003558 [Mactra antiquata]